jgi:hypothetical protein
MYRTPVLRGDADFSFVSNQNTGVDNTKACDKFIIGGLEPAVDTAELVIGFEHPGDAPAQRHRRSPPALDVLGVLPADLDHGLDRVGNRYEDLRRRRFCRLLRYRAGLAGMRCDRPGQGRRE